MIDSFTPTPGPYMVRPTTSAIPDHLTIAHAETNEVIAVIPPKNGQPNWADAAALATAPNALETLIDIQVTLMNSKETIDLEEIVSKISLVFEKIAAECG
jgi:hypothetical protein